MTPVVTVLLNYLIFLAIGAASYFAAMFGFIGGTRASGKTRV